MCGGPAPWRSALGDVRSEWPCRAPVSTCSCTETQPEASGGRPIAAQLGQVPGGRSNHSCSAPWGRQEGGSAGLWWGGRLLCPNEMQTSCPFPATHTLWPPSSVAPNACRPPPRPPPLPSLAARHTLLHLLRPAGGRGAAVRGGGAGRAVRARCSSWAKRGGSRSERGVRPVPSGHCSRAVGEVAPGSRLGACVMRPRHACGFRGASHKPGPGGKPSPQRPRAPALLQICAAHATVAQISACAGPGPRYCRGWYYHKEYKAWLTRAPNTEPLQKTDRWGGVRILNSLAKPYR